MAFLTGTVDVFRIVKASAVFRLNPGVFGNRKGNVRLQRQQTAVQVGKGDDLLAGQKPPVLLVETVFLKPAHAVLPESRPFVQQPQLQGNPLLRPQDIQIQFHGKSSFMVENHCTLFFQRSKVRIR